MAGRDRLECHCDTQTNGDTLPYDERLVCFNGPLASFVGGVGDGTAGGQTKCSEIVDHFREHIKRFESDTE